MNTSYASRSFGDITRDDEEVRRKRKPSIREIKKVCASLKRQIRKEQRKRELFKQVDILSTKLMDIREGRDYESNSDEE